MNIKLSQSNAYNESPENLKRIISRLPDYIFWQDEHDSLLGYNNLAKDFFGLGENSNSRSVPLVISKNEILIKNLNLLNKKIFKGKIITCDEYNYKLSHQTKITFSITKEPLYDQNGVIFAVLTIAQDITSKKIQQNDIVVEKLTSDALLETVMSLVPGHLFIQDKNGVFIACNEKQALSAGYKTKSDLIGKTVYDFLPKDEADNITRTNENIFENGLPLTVEEPGTYKLNNQKSMFLSQKIPIRDKNYKIVGLIGIAFDITDQKERESNLKKSIEETHLLNEIFRQYADAVQIKVKKPIGDIISLLSLYKVTDEKDKQDEYIDLAYTFSTKIIPLLDTTYNLISTQNSPLHILREKINLNLILEGIVESYYTLSKKKNTDLILNYPKNIPYILYTDSNKLIQVLEIVVNNAIDATSDGFIFISVDCLHNDSIRKTQIKVMIEDTGCGIDPLRLNQLFLPKLSSAEILSQSVSKAGFSLTIANNMIQAMDGSIEIQSSKNSGTKLTISLLIEDISISTLNNFTHREGKLLIIDNNIKRASIFKDYLSDCFDIFLTTLNALNLNPNSCDQYDLIFINHDNQEELSELVKNIRRIKSYEYTKILIYTTEETHYLYSFKNKRMKLIQKPCLPSNLVSNVYEFFKEKLPRVLLIEDEPICALYQKKMLESLGFEVILVGSVEEALPVLKQFIFDAILSDIDLPGISGETVPKLVNEIQPSYKNDIYAVTSNASEVDRNRYYDLGFTEVIPKPANLTNFKRILENINN